MTQSKPTSLRILPSQKKTGPVPAVYLFIGFFSGAFISGAVVYLWATQQFNSATMLTLEQANASAASTTDITSASATNHEATPDNSTDHISQPQDSELSNIFRHEPTTTNAAHPVSKTVHNKAHHTHTATASQTSPFPKATTSTSTEEKAMPATTPQPQNNPQASLNIAMTHSPFSVKENQ
ncbi:hypothetical protein E0H86_00930 [Acinetobacter sp. ANC 4635]|uniref:hypothetical protein n=1 Tax=Acinetobacter sp. ANC 4635 TaxID=2529846 RepID=UPI00103BE93F|nr:hypothetical protein [Acinetobacter sp. ANC 4635]TCB33238.1 hypothetical protein E0H86_00930 [Acinetobacter sp. ANC 4635]